MVILRACSGIIRRLVITSRTQLRPASRGAKTEPPKQRLQFDTRGVQITKMESDAGFLEWCTTEPGRIRVGQFAVLWGGIVIGIVTASWNILLVFLTRDAYLSSDGEDPTIQSTLRRVGRGERTEVGMISDDFIRLFTSCQSRSGVNDVNFDQIEIFYSTMLDPVSHGMSNTRQGAVVGFPRHSLGDQVDLSTLRIKPFYNYFHKGYRAPLNLCEEAKADLQQVLALTPEEREFVMSKELAKVDSWGPLRETVVYPVAWVVHYLATRTFNTRMGLMAVSRRIRWPINAALGAVTCFFLLYFKNAHAYETEINAIDTVCKTRHQAQIAVDYFQKIINRNKVLYQILGTDGAYCFTEEGEFQPMFYEMPIVSLKNKLEFCKSRENELE